MPTPDVHTDLESHRRELTGFCYRFLGSASEAEDAVQEALTRAWSAGDTFEGRSSVRTWLYRIATNVCIDMQRAPQRRALPHDLASPGRVPDDPRTLTTGPAEQWLTPIADSTLLDDPGDPAERVAVRDSVRLALLSALQRLPPRQRVVLILRDVLGWSARECADLLDTTEDAVTSALARARRTMQAHDPGAPSRLDPDTEQALLERYMDAFADYDVDRLVALLVEDARFTMPPYELWLRGSDTIERWWRGPGTVCVGSRVLRAGVNGMPAVAVYHPTDQDVFLPFAVHAIDMVPANPDERTAHAGVQTPIPGQIAGITHFMGAAVFEQLGLPDQVHP